MTKKRGELVHGWLVLNKPRGITSTKALALARRFIGGSKVGHAGTLDPLASGILPLAFGEATKTVPYLVGAEKCYRFIVRWGAETTTDDAEGEVAHTCATRPSVSAIIHSLEEFTGEIAQVPPSFSAIKVDGERAYDLSREGVVVQLASRRAFVRRLEWVDRVSDSDDAFEMVCGKGTYVRAVARDLGRLLGCYGHVQELTRVRVGGFDLRSAISLEMLEKSANDGAAKSFLVPLSTALDDIPALAVSPQEAAQLRMGQLVLARGRVSLSAATMLRGPPHDELHVLCRTSSGDPVAIALFAAGELRPVRVFNFFR